MSDFLSPAINERIKEKNMDFDTKLENILSPEPDTAAGQTIRWAAHKPTKEAIKQLFLDTIEKAKPDSYDNSLDEAYDVWHDAIGVYHDNLVKEINK